ncbi:MAG: glycosyltransferase family 4 protein, partial [Actinobacteria bacterium]|nr:glycosyltransferase family 4 protein [Actinomycetota bacterium]
IGVFHNVTPPELVDDPETRWKLGASLAQVHNLARCDEVLCDSAFNRYCLAALGVAEVPTRVLELPPALDPLPRREAEDHRTHVLFVGRFVRAKGVLDLLHALARAVAEGASDVQVTMAGSPVFSDRSVVASLQDTIDDLGLTDTVEVLLAPDDVLLAERFAAADVLVLPSYHEGYCVPVVEAMASGCHLIVYDAGSLPDTAAGLGLLVETGNVEALGDAIALYCSRRRNAPRAEMLVPTSSGDLPHDEWERRVAAVMAGRSLEFYEQAFLEVLDDQFRQRGWTSPAWRAAS